MGTEEAIQEFLRIWTVVYTDASLDQLMRLAKLDVSIKDLLERKGLPKNQKMSDRDQEGSCCKA